MTGQTISHFELLDKLGEGGMGVVYRARDTQLNREVAIKVLRPDKVANTNRRLRFIQEARSASALNHPNIITIYEIGEANGTEFIAMELVTGRALDQLIPPKGMRLNDTLKYAIQIADALTKAHSAGITHRDLKPANIMVNAEGRIKILDFGLAKLTESLMGSSESTATFTVHPEGGPHTAEGAIVGTAAYMSPEQAEGKPVDARSDIFSFGCVLYELASGHRAFQAATPMATLAAVIREDPAKLPKGTPRELEKLIARCLRKDSERRAQHISDVRLALEEIKEESDSGTLNSPAPGAITSSRPPWLLPALAALVLVVSAGAWLALRAPKPPLQAEVKRSVLTSYPGSEIEPALSPDGKYVAFAWNGEKEDNFDIYVKLVDAGTPVRLTHDPASDTAPAYSPDGSFLAFVRTSQGKGGYYVIPALGGNERRVADIPMLGSHSPFPSVDWSPDGKSLVITDTSVMPIYISIVSLASGEKRRLTLPPTKSFGDSKPLVSPDGKWLAFLRTENVSSSDWFLLPFDEKPGAEPKRLTEFHANFRAGGAWLSNSRELFLSGATGAQTRPWRVSAQGGAASAVQVPFLGEADISPAIARQGGRAVFWSALTNTNLWRLDLKNPATPSMRIIASSRSEVQPDYSPDSSRISFISSRLGEYEVWAANSDGSNPIQLTNQSASPTAPRWSPDGRLIAFAKRPGGNVDVYIINAEGGPPRRLTTDPGNDASAYWSLDGKTVYFASNRTGRNEVWKIPADGSRPETQITRNGGWRSNEFASGTMLAYQKFDLPGLWKISVAGGEEQKIADTPAGATYFATGNTGYWYSSDLKLHRVDLLTGKESIVLTLPPATTLDTVNFTVSADQRWLVYVHTDQSINDLVLLENIH